MMKKWFFPLKRFFRKCSYEDVKSSFGNRAEVFMQKSRKVFAENPKMIRKLYVFKKSVSPKYSNGHVDCSFDNLAKKFAKGGQ